MPADALPSFRNPPVTEVVVGVAFKPIDGLSVPRIGQLWSEKFAEHFTRAEDQPPYEPPIERFEDSLPTELFGLQLVSGAFPRPRVWFLNQAGDELVQIQRNYFACNWRKVHPDAQYGRWASRRDTFKRWFAALQSFLTEHSLGEILPTQCEVTYVNHIEPGDGWSSHGEAAAILRVVATPPYDDEDFHGLVEHVQLAEQFRLEKDGEPFGRLHMAFQPAFRRSDNRPIYILELTARGRPLGDSTDGMLMFFEEGRKAIVTAFAAVTTPAMQHVWDRYD